MNDLRGHLLAVWDTLQLARSLSPGLAKLRDADVLTHYGTQVWSRRRKTPVNVDELVARWVDVVVVLSTEHDKQAVDDAEFRMDELLTPLLTAPVAQLREFRTAFLDALRADERVPFFVWSTFAAYDSAVLERAEARPEIRRLRKKLAREIAAMVDEDVRPDIATAIAGALMWRPPEALKEIKADLEAGAKPKLKGRESCLFLSVQRPGAGYPERLVML